jgi:hypothetical protein
MNSSIPSANWLIFWRTHFVLALALTVCAAWQFLSSMTQSGVADSLSYAMPRSLAAMGFAVIVVIAPLIAEWGFIRQRGIERRSFWRLLFIVQACLSVVGILMTVGVAMLFGDMSLSSVEDGIDVIAALVSAGQLWAVWLYAYRSDHLWSEAGVAEST